MKKSLSRTVGTGVIISLLLVPVLILKAAPSDNHPQIEARAQGQASTTNLIPKPVKIENREQKLEAIMVRASTTQTRLENRENNIERIRERLASTNASTSEKRVEKINNQLQKQYEQMERTRARILGIEVKVVDVLGKIASKIQERITILEDKGFDMTNAKAKLDEVSVKIEEMTAESDSLATLINTEITEENKATLFQDIRASQVKIKTLARATHALLVDTIKEITKNNL